jgi:hypothetical protein
VDGGEEGAHGLKAKGKREKGKVTAFSQNYSGAFIITKWGFLLTAYRSPLTIKL